MTIERVETRHPVLHEPSRFLLAAITVGVGFDLLAMGRPHGPGLAVALIALTATVLWAARHERAAGTDTVGVAVTALTLASVPAWRDSTVIVSLALLGWLGLTAVMLRTGAPRLVTWTAGSYARAATEPILALAEPFPMITNDIAERSDGSMLTRIARALPIARGIVLGAAVVGFFAVLFGSADPIFAQIVSDALDLDLSFDRFVRFVFVSGFVGWWTIGLARRAAGPDGHGHTYRPTGLGLTESRIVTLAVNALFAAFVAVQVDYLFAGQVGRVDMGYAEYARRGFFELVAVAICVAVLILSIDWMVHRRDRLLDAMHTILVIQTFVVMASALLRMKAYVDAYGLSELRFYTTAFMFWTAVVLLALLVTVLRSRRDRFALVGVVSALLFVFGLAVANPDARIASVNIDRASPDVELDAVYLSTLSNDAIPLVLTELRSREGVVFETALTTVLPVWTTRLEADLADGWRSWSLSDSVARRALDDRR